MYTDTTFVSNKLSINSFNQQIKKTQNNKKFNNPILVVTTGSKIDSLIFNKQLDVLHKEHPIIFNNNKILLVDAAYDSSTLRDKAKQLNFEKMLTCKNIRNSKEPIEKINLYEKLLLKKKNRC